MTIASAEGASEENLWASSRILMKMSPNLLQNIWFEYNFEFITQPKIFEYKFWIYNAVQNFWI